MNAMNRKQLEKTAKLKTRTGIQRHWVVNQSKQQIATQIIPFDVHYPMEYSPICWRAIISILVDETNLRYTDVLKDRISMLKTKHAICLNMLNVSLNLISTFAPTLVTWYPISATVVVISNAIKSWDHHRSVAKTDYYGMIGHRLVTTHYLWTVSILGNKF
jgi:hypothetical protein